MPLVNNPGLHGAVRHRARVAVVLIDVINAMDFPEGPQLAKHGFPAAKAIVKLKQRARAANVPIVYANDNYGRWRSDFRATIENALQPDMPGREIAAMLVPDPEDYFVLKPKHSAFYSSSLELLLSYFGAERVVLAGFAGDICVHFTAHDAFLRDFQIIVARDATASEDRRSNTLALEHMRTQLGAKIADVARIDLRALRRRSGQR